MSEEEEQGCTVPLGLCVHDTVTIINVGHRSEGRNVVRKVVFHGPVAANTSEHATSSQQQE